MSDRMTHEEFEAKMDEELKKLPIEFQQYVISESYDRGHAYGYDEIYNIACGMAYSLEKVIDVYDARIRSHTSCRCGDM